MDVETPKPPRLLGFRLSVYPSPQFLQIHGRLCHPFPASPCGRKIQTQHGPFAPSALPDFTAPTDHSAILLPSSPFRVSSYRADPAPQISPTGIQDFSSFCRVLVAVSPPIPRRCGLSPLASVRYSILSSPYIEWLDPRILALTRLAQRSLTLQPGNSLISPKLTLSVGSSISITLHAATQARRLLALTAAGLPSNKMRVTLWITTAFHLDTPTERFDPFGPFFFQISSLASRKPMD